MNCMVLKTNSFIIKDKSSNKIRHYHTKINEHTYN